MQYSLPDDSVVNLEPHYFRQLDNFFIENIISHNKSDSIMPISKLFLTSIRNTEKYFNNNIYNASSQNITGNMGQVSAYDTNLSDLKLYSDIVVVGGNTLCNGFIDRMSELCSNQQRDIKDLRYRVFEFPQAENRLVSSWVGGSILMSVNGFKNFMITKEEWDENGISILERKCP